MTEQDWLGVASALLKTVVTGAAAYGIYLASAWVCRRLNDAILRTVEDRRN